MSNYLNKRMNEVSKQEEIILKKRQEIENNLDYNSSSYENKSANKFSNDGSFLEQFKMMSKKPQGSETLMRPHHAFSDEDSRNNSVEPGSSSQSEKKLEDHPEWFQEALKRAKEKAKELQSVSHSVSPLNNSSKRTRWTDSADVSQGAPSVPAPPVTPQVGQSMGGIQGFNVPLGVIGMVGEGQHMEAIQGVMITKLSRDNASIVNYAKQVFGTLDLTDAQWKQCEEQMKMNVVFQLLQAKKVETERLQQQGKVKYEYDSDEETDGGTWEHKRRRKEMEETSEWADQLTKQSEGKHHIGDFLPPQELARFMEKYQALKEGRDPDLSDYKEHKLTEDNIGYKMLKSMGWTEGTGLGADRKGIVQPVNQNARTENSAIGAERPDKLTENDDEYEAYRKRMMLAYRFRPNPLNNPRRAYY